MELFNKASIIFINLLLLESLVAYSAAQSSIKTTDTDGNQDVSKESNREGKLFSLFNVVQFKNLPCVTSATLPSGSGRRRGTCYTATECRSKRGISQGSCASGFGVCCLFVASATSSTVNQNCSYIQNPGYPSPYADSTSVSYTINKCSSDVCFLRLDFETFSLLGVGIAAGDGTNLCQDQFDVSLTSGQRIPTICGENSGQHIFIDLIEGSSDSATLSFDFADASNKQWDIKVTQYTCSSENAPPDGCLQYHTGITGKIKTFNYDLSNDNHLPNQEYSICVRQENGYCCIRYTVCQNEDLGFSLSTTAMAKQDDVCKTMGEDFILIPDSSSSCSQTPGAQLTNRYCGNIFSDIIDGTANIPICDCTPPFTVGVITNNIADAVTADQSKGICLDYEQLPCTG